MDNPYYAQSNDPRDLHHEHFNISQQRQQSRLGMQGGSWSQPSWTGWKPIIGAGHNNMFQRYAQDGDAGFFYGMGSGEPLGVNPIPPNSFEKEEAIQFKEPEMSMIRPIVTEPTPKPDATEMQQELLFSAEPQQRAVHVPPYSQSLYQGLGRANTEDDVLHEEPLEIPKYRGGFHKKENLIKRR